MNCIFKKCSDWGMMICDKCPENEDAIVGCPICGGKAKFIDYLGSAYRQHRIVCAGEKPLWMDFPDSDRRCLVGRPFDEKEDALRIWNTRAELINK